MSTMGNERDTPSAPFEDEREVTADPAATHDDISAAQTEARAAARISGEHEEGLLYQPGYILDPRSGGKGALYYPSADVSGETQEEQRG
jgi:hypothetical protein